MAENVCWWDLRRAQNRKPATYRCPLCGEFLPALSEHVLLFPEGDRSRRRHAHSACVLAARKAGRLPTRQEWLRSQPREPRSWRRVLSGLWPRGTGEAERSSEAEGSPPDEGPGSPGPSS